VKEKAKPITEFTLPDKTGRQVPIKQVIPNAPDASKPADQLEHYVRVEWIKTVPLDKAIKEKGFFGNQNSAAKPKAKKWVHTIERLKKRFGIED